MSTEPKELKETFFNSDSETEPDKNMLSTISSLNSQTDSEERSKSTCSSEISHTDSESKIIATESQQTGLKNNNKNSKRVRSGSAAKNIIAINSKLSVETDAEKAKSDLLDLIESLKSKRILQGTIQGVEQSDDGRGPSVAVIYHGGIKVMIPADETVTLPDDLRGMTENAVYRYLLMKRLGAEIDYIVKGIDADSGLAVASRKEAMAAKRKEYYFGSDRNGNNLLYEGICAEARIISVIRAGIFVDIFGAECYIPLRELSYQRMIDATSEFEPGECALVKILSIDRSDREKIKVSASVKQAHENPYQKAIKKYSVNSQYVGTVSVVDTNGVFVALDGIDCLCSYPKRGRPPKGSRVTVRILGINYESNRIWGVITHFSMPR